MSKLQPLNGYLILRPIEEEEQMYGNIVIPDLGKERPEMGEVIATSSTYNFNSDKFVESNLQVGDKVLIPKLGSLRITVEGEEYFITKEQDVYSKLV
jgi:chaperonin GroES